MSDPTEKERATPSPGPTAMEAELPDLTREELVRYARHLVLPEVEEEGQRRLKGAHVLLVGAGGLGSPLALYLAAAGVGTLGIVDSDRVEASNLQRQVLHGTSDVGRPKTDSARERLAEINPEVSVEAFDVRLTSENALELLEPYDVVVDGSDNFPTRYLVNDACVLLGIPNVYGSIFRWEGQVSVFAARDPARGARGPCYRCLFREPPPPGLVPSCAEGGVFGVLPGVVGSLQATETLKLILGVGEPLVGRILIFDALEMSWREVEVPRNPDCPVCGDEPTQTELIDYELFCGVSDGQAETGAEPRSGAPGAESATAEGDTVGEGDEGAPTPPGPDRPEIGARDLERWLEEGRDPLILDVRQPWEWRVGNLEELGARLIPLMELEERRGELPRDREIVVCCRTGARSADATRFLRAAGYDGTYNLRGGLTAWKAQVDPDLSVA